MGKDKYPDLSEELCLFIRAVGMGSSLRPLNSLAPGLRHLVSPFCLRSDYTAVGYWQECYSLPSGGSCHAGPCYEKSTFEPPLSESQLGEGRRLCFRTLR